MSQQQEAEPLQTRPFGIEFQEVVREELAASTNTRSSSDDDTGTFRKETDDGDT
jgi:hypothetical protein